jgi:23S rRNA (cytidine1920-2'-O)/16S rRNA (cytidine1409-2'-O)-methyltransferase
LFVENQRKKYEAVLRPLARAHGFYEGRKHTIILPVLCSDGVSGPVQAYNCFMPKIRLDVLLVERGLAESRAKAQAMIMAGQVRIAGQVTLRPATAISADSVLTVDSGPRFVSRGGEKLDAALEAFGMDIAGLICADVGASTGGFTDCLLQRGAVKVYAIDVGKGILHWRLRNDPRVVVMEETNARFVESLPEQVSLVTVDASFISLKICCLW